MPVLEARSGEPDGEPVLVVVAALADDVGGRLGERSAAELGREEDQGVVEQAAPAEVAEQPGDRAVDPQRLLAVVGLHVFVPVPVAPRAAEGAAGEELHEPHARARAAGERSGRPGRSPASRGRSTP